MKTKSNIRDGVESVPTVDPEWEMNEGERLGWGWLIALTLIWWIGEAVITTREVLAHGHRVFKKLFRADKPAGRTEAPAVSVRGGKQ